MENTGGEKVLEFNSNVEVLMRAASIIRAINSARFQIMNKDEDGNPMASIEELVSHIITLFKEVSVEMQDTVRGEMWERLKLLRNKIENNPPKPGVSGIYYWRTTLHEIDELDLELRQYAKKHGFLSANKLDVRRAGMRR